MMLRFQNKFIHFNLTNILSFYEKVIEENKEDMKIRTSENQKYCKSTALQYLLSTYYCHPLWNMKKRNEKENTTIHQFQVGCMSNTVLNINMAFR